MCCADQPKAAVARSLQRSQIEQQRRRFAQTLFFDQSTTTGAGRSRAANSSAIVCEARRRSKLPLRDKLDRVVFPSQLCLHFENPMEQSGGSAVRAKPRSPASGLHPSERTEHSADRVATPSPARVAFIPTSQIGFRTTARRAPGHQTPGPVCKCVIPCPIACSVSDEIHSRSIGNRQPASSQQSRKNQLAFATGITGIHPPAKTMNGLLAAHATFHCLNPDQSVAA